MWAAEEVEVGTKEKEKAVDECEVEEEIEEEETRKYK